jgi:hypothetical protein
MNNNTKEWLKAIGETIVLTLMLMLFGICMLAM